MRLQIAVFQPEEASVRQIVAIYRKKLSLPTCDRTTAQLEASSICRKSFQRIRKRRKCSAMLQSHSLCSLDRAENQSARGATQREATCNIPIMHVWYRWTEESRQTEIDARERSQSSHSSRGELRCTRRWFHESSRSSRWLPSATFGSLRLYKLPRGRNAAGSRDLSRGSCLRGQVRPISWGAGDFATTSYVTGDALGTDCSSLACCTVRFNVRKPHFCGFLILFAWPFLNTHRKQFRVSEMEALGTREDCLMLGATSVKVKVTVR